ncbi:hypothetical protein [Cryptosporangium aurantiacum]|uniref:hypothetical protein n=1 Tax=Cryptosporangium aurantiacum TaxID=134849 RepID=UPI0011614316|nr:hypothetical protein [Cryptosporangium aurantiacum]
MLLALAGGALAYAGARRTGPLAAPPPEPAESALIADGQFPLGGWTAESAAALQVAAYRAVRDTVPGVTAARELMVLAAVVTAVLVGVLARRVGSSLPATALAVVVAAGLPWAVAGHRLVTPVNLAVPWLLAAVLLARPTTRRAIPPAVLCAGVGVLTAPLVAPVAVTTTAAVLACRDVGAGWTRSTRIAGVAVLGVLAAGLFVLVGFDAAPRVRPTVVDWVVLGAVVLGAAIGTIVRWLRPFAFVVLVCGVVAATAAPIRTPLLLLALPAAAVVLGATIDAAATVSGVRSRVRATAAAVTVVLVAGVALVLTGPQVTAAARSGPVEAVAWARDHSGTALLVVDDAVWTASGDPGGLPDAERGRVLRYRDTTADSLDQADVLLIGVRPEPGSAAASAWQRSVRIARFERSEVRLVVPSVAKYERAAAAGRIARRSAVRALLPLLVARPPVVSVLSDAEVDGRLLTVLTELATDYRLEIAALPAVPGESGPYSLRRQARITSLDGVPVGPDAPSTEVLRQWLQAQLPPHQPIVSVGRDGVTVRFPAPSALGVL